MKHLLFIVFTAIFCASALAQNIKTLGYNTTNGQVVANTGTNVLTFKGGSNQPYNVVRFIEGTWGTGFDIVATDENLDAGYDAASGSIGVGAGQFWIKYGTNSGNWARPLSITANAQLVNNIGTNVLSFSAGSGMSIANSNNNVNLTVNENGLSFSTGPSGAILVLPTDDTVQLGGGVWNDSSVRSSLGFSTNLNALWTATNTSNARTAIGLGVTNVVNFSNVITDKIYTTNGRTAEEGIDLTNGRLLGTWRVTEDLFAGYVEAGSGTNWVSIGALTGLNFGNPSIARTSARNLAGSTNTNEPYSGTVALTNTNVLTFSNGVLLRIQ